MTRSGLWGAVVGVVLVWILSLYDPRPLYVEREASPSSTTGTEATATWPITTSAEPSEVPLRARIPSDRGALRVFVEDSAGDWRLEFARGDGGGHVLETRSPDYVAPGTLEFYGLESGAIWACLKRGDEKTLRFRQDIFPYAMSAVRANTLAAFDSKSLVLRREGRPYLDNATLLLQYPGFVLVRQWRGVPIRIEDPFIDIESLTVRAGELSPSVALLGGLLDVQVSGGEVSAELPAGSTSIQMVTSGASDRRERKVYELGIVVGGTDAPRRYLTCSRERGFSEIGALHTFATAPADDSNDTLSVMSVPEGKVFIGAGILDRFRYCLWRRWAVGPVEDREFQCTTPRPRAGGLDGGRIAVLPGFLGWSELDGPHLPGRRMRAVADAVQMSVPSRLYERLPFEDGEVVRFLGLRSASSDGRSWRADLRPFLLGTGGLNRDRTGRTRATVRRPGASARDAPLYSLVTMSANCIDNELPGSADGCLFAEIKWENGSLSRTHGVLQNGVALTTGAWKAVGIDMSTTVIRGPGTVRAIDDKGMRVPEFTVHVDDSSVARASDGAARVMLPDHPAVAHLRISPGQFDHHFVTQEGENLFRLEPEPGEPNSRRDVLKRLGILLSGDIFPHFELVAIPGGESLSLGSHESLHPRRLAEHPIEVTARGSPTFDVWGWLPASEHETAGDTAEIVIVGGATRENVFIALSHALIRCNVPPRKIVRIPVVANCEIRCISAGRFESVKDTAESDRSKTVFHAFLEAGDILSIHVDG